MNDYILRDGTRAPGVTTVLNVLNKPGLLPVAVKLALQGVDPLKHWETLALVGTIAHDMILCHHQGREFDPSQHSPKLVERAENCLRSYDRWAEGKIIEPILCEASLVSEAEQFGGTPDFYGKVDGVLTLMDYKTSSIVWPEHRYQVSAYKKLLEDNGHRVDAVQVFSMPRDARDKFSARQLTEDELTRGLDIFRYCLGLYRLRAVYPCG